MLAVSHHMLVHPWAMDAHPPGLAAGDLLRLLNVVVPLGDDRNATVDPKCRSAASAGAVRVLCVGSSSWDQRGAKVKHVSKVT